MKIKSTFILRKIAGVSVVVPVGDATKDLDGMMKLNETGEFIFTKLQNEDLTEDELVSRLTEEYDVDENRAREDIAQFIGKLNEIHCFE